jgi:hypothetical protein
MRDQEYQYVDFVPLYCTETFLEVIPFHALSRCYQIKSPVFSLSRNN